MASIRQPSLSPMWYMAALVFDEHEEYFEAIMNGAACVLLLPVLLRFRYVDRLPVDFIELNHCAANVQQTV